MRATFSVSMPLMSKNVKEIVSQWLKETGNDGLVDMDNGCSCELGDDFMSCGDPNTECTECLVDRSGKRKSETVEGGK